MISWRWFGFVTGLEAHPNSTYSVRTTSFLEFGRQLCFYMLHYYAYNVWCHSVHQVDNLAMAELNYSVCRHRKSIAKVESLLHLWMAELPDFYKVHEKGYLSW